MSRDPKVVGRAKVSAEMLAEVVNGFVEPISWKTLVSNYGVIPRHSVDKTRPSRYSACCPLLS